MRVRRFFHRQAVIAMALLTSRCSPARPGVVNTKSSDPIVRSEFIFESGPYPSCHAATIAQTRSGFAAAWFGGTRERAPDVGIWVARHDGKRWSEPVEVAIGT